MFQINQSENSISKLERKSFSELKLREREHLQEWLAGTPEALGEELLIIQKEFDGFNDTRERLDLLALDKNGLLVIIENKLDDTGRDVVWQGLKYASYCSNLTKSQIITIYQQYIDRYEGGGDAKTKLLDFFGEHLDFDELVLNSDNEQRLMLVAANFRKEVTATAMWLISHNIRVQCFKVSPFAFGEELLLDVQQIIPPPEAEEFMISMSDKQAEVQSIKTTQRNSHTLRLAYWEQLLERFIEKGVKLYQNRSAGRDHWLSAGSGMSACPYQLIFNKTEIRVQLAFERESKDENKAIFDQLYRHKEKLENDLRGKLEWVRLDEKKSAYIRCICSYDGYNRENWPEMIDWMAEHVVKMEKAFKAPLAKINQAMKAGSG